MNIVENTISTEPQPQLSVLGFVKFLRMGYWSFSNHSIKLRQKKKKKPSSSSWGQHHPVTETIQDTRTINYTPGFLISISATFLKQNAYKTNWTICQKCLSLWSSWCLSRHLRMVTHMQMSKSNIMYENTDRDYRFLSQCKISLSKIRHPEAGGWLSPCCACIRTQA